MADTLYAILIQVTGQMLLLPNAAVAEVTALDRFEPAEEGSPDWLAGWHATAERRVPVLNFEALSGKARPSISRRGRVVIVNPVGQRVGAGGYGLLAQGHPHMVSIARGAIEAVDLHEDDQASPVLSRVRMAGQEALIPDLDRIETRLAGLA